MTVIVETTIKTNILSILYIIHSNVNYLWLLEVWKGLREKYLKYVLFEFFIFFPKTEKWPWIKTIRAFWYFIGLFDTLMHCKSWLFFNDESLMRKRYLARLKVSDQVGHNHIKINTDSTTYQSDIPPSPLYYNSLRSYF